MYYQGLLGCGARLNPEADFGEDSEGAKGAAEEFGQVVAGDVFDHPAAGADALSVAVDHLEAQQVVAQGAGFEAPGAGEVAGDGAADSGCRAPAGGFEGELLVIAG